MRHGPLVALFVILLMVAVSFVVGTSGALPERVASHFDATGLANGYMTRDGYRLFMLAFSLGFPLLMVALISWLPRLVPDLTNIPNRAYWFAPERRETTLATLEAYALRLGCLLTVMAGGVHWLVIRANGVAPPRLENAPFLALLGAFLAALTLWIVMLLRRFRKTP